MTIEGALELLDRGDPSGALVILERQNDGGASTDPRYHSARGMALLGENRPAEALAALRLAVACGDTSPSGLLNLAIAEDRAGDLKRGRRLMQDLSLRFPEWDEPVLRLAESFRAHGEATAAEHAYSRVLSINPGRVEALIALAGLLILRGQAEAARPLLLQCCGLTPERADAWDTLGIALIETRKCDLAHTAFVEAQRRNPRILDYALRRVSVAIKLHRAEADLALLQLDAAADPLNPVPHIAAGMLLEHLNRRSEAISEYQIAVGLAPDDAMASAFLGSALSRTSRLHEAEAALRRAAELDPTNIGVRNNHAATLMRMHRHAQAATVLQALVEEGGDDWQTLCNLANTVCCLGQQEEAIRLARRAIAIAPDELNPRRTLVGALAYSGGVTGIEILTAAQACAVRLHRAAMPAFANAAVPERPLRVGLLSGALKTHPVGWLTIAAFEALDPARFGIIGLAQNSWGDAIARRFRAIAREWHDTSTLNDEALASRTRDIGIDVLIDLGGYGEGSRMGACALRLAPVQIKWVGMQSHTTGLPEMDWMLTDRWETPPHLAHLYTERLLVMPDGYVCYSPSPDAPDVGPLPTARNGHVTFGCFNNLAKVTAEVTATWCRVLDRVPGSRLVLKTHQCADPAVAGRIRAAFAAHGIEGERLELRGPSAHRTFIGEYNDIDIVLDPFPYSGGLTTCEALWMGVPTVTLPGEIFASRHSLSHLSNVGLADWVAPTAADYVDLAVAKASDPDALATLRSELRARVAASPLCDAPRFGRNLDAALRFAWREWCSHAA
jgi:predicted O-linked N-acetylglucosamine transferase (SPINDLY family)